MSKQKIGSTCNGVLRKKSHIDKKMVTSEADNIKFKITFNLQLAFEYVYMFFFFLHFFLFLFSKYKGLTRVKI